MTDRRQTKSRNLDCYLATPIEEVLDAHEFFAGIVGDRPSQYAKSPSLWNPAFKELGINAVYVAFDVDAPKLKPLIQELRRCKGLIGFSVTVPYKVEIVPLLDDLEHNAKRIGAVNTVARTREGRLVGYNTDGQGAIDSLTRTSPGQNELFLASLAGLRVILLGAGGAARAVAFFLAEALGPQGHIYISNRDPKKAKDLARAVSEAYKNCSSIQESDLENALAEADLVINATTKGQSGLRALDGERVTCLEPYSALAPAHSPSVNRDSYAKTEEFYARWFPLARNDIQENLEISSARILRLKASARLFDLIYSPLETVFLSQGRLSGHPTLNGKGMNIWQAVDGFCNKVMKNFVERDPLAFQDRVYDVMSSVW